MAENLDYVRFVKGAQLGDKSCLEQLSKEAETRLRVDVLRLSLEPDLTEDIVQETMLEMLKILSELKEADRFWPWLYKIALNKLRRHRRTQRRQKTVPISAISGAQEQKDSREAMSNMVSQELKEIVLKAMGGLRPQHRAVLTMRCYREMEYSVIGETLGCSEFAAKMQFYRAKKALRRQLAREGFGKGSLLMALILFGKLTAPAEAASVSVSTAATKVGVAAGVVGVLSSKTAVLCLATAGVVTAGALVATSGPEGGAEARGGAMTESSRAGQASRADEEYWYYFPRGTDGPVMMRLMKSASSSRANRCARMQDDQGNYRVDMGENTIYVENHRLWHEDMSVWRLPTDSAALGAFISQTEGRADDLEYVTTEKSGLMAVVRRAGNPSTVWTTHHRHVLMEEYFRYGWPAGATTVDNRDSMHERGWTYFTVEGRVGEGRWSGAGRVPFVYAASFDHRPWIRLELGNQMSIVDTGREAIVRENGKVVASYEGGSFFKGLSRPWMGLHTIDTVRRDAAEREIRFETVLDDRADKAQVVLMCEQGKLVYTIDMETDVVEQIIISTGDGQEGGLRFTYLQDIDQAGSQFNEPRIDRDYGRLRQASPGILWLVHLARPDDADSGHPTRVYER